MPCLMRKRTACVALVAIGATVPVEIRVLGATTERVTHNGRRSEAEGSQAAATDVEAALTARYKRRERSVEDALNKMYLAVVSLRAWRTSPRHFGHKRQPWDGVKSQQEDLCRYGMAKAAAYWHLSL